MIVTCRRVGNRRLASSRVYDPSEPVFDDPRGLGRGEGEGEVQPRVKERFELRVSRPVHGQFLGWEFPRSATREVREMIFSPSHAEVMPVRVPLAGLV